MSRINCVMSNSVTDWRITKETCGVFDWKLDQKRDMNKKISDI